MDAELYLMARGQELAELDRALERRRSIEERTEVRPASRRDAGPAIERLTAWVRQHVARESGAAAGCCAPA